MTCSLQQRIFKLPGVSSVRSNVVLREVKYETALPVGVMRRHSRADPGGSWLIGLAALRQPV